MRLAEIAHVNFGKQLRDRKKFVNDVITVPSRKEMPPTHKPCVSGSDVRRYELTWSGLACLDSTVAQSGGCWDSDRQNAKNKLLTRQIGRHPEFAIDTAGVQCLNTIFMVGVFDRSYDPWFLLGVLNSSVTRFLWGKKFFDQRKTFPKIKGTYLKELPVPKATAKQQQAVSATVQNILAAKSKIGSAVTDRDRGYLNRRCAELEPQIDQLVYELYGLTEDEIRIVEAG